MDGFVIVYRLFVLGIIGYWLVQIAIARGKPPEWQPTRADEFPVRLTRDRYIVAGVLGIIASAAVFAFSFVLFP